jgi:glutathione reductase (NADPH)
MERMLTSFDPDLVDALMEKTRRLGVELRLGTHVERVEETADGFRLHARSGEEPVSVDADLVVHGEPDGLRCRRRWSQGPAADTGGES